MSFTDFHCHPFEKARSLEGMRAFARAARDRGLAGLVFTEHAPLLPGGLSWDELPVYIEHTRRIKAEFAPYPIYLGIEIDYRPDLEGEAERVLAHADFEYVVGSIHLHTSVHRDSVVGRDFGGAVLLGLERTRQAAHSGLFTTIAHLDFFRMLVDRPAFAGWKGGYDPRTFEEPFRGTLAVLQETRTVLEVNTSGLRKVFASLLPCPEILRWADDYHLRYVIGSDAHEAEFVGTGFDTALAALTNSQRARILPKP